MNDPSVIPPTDEETPVTGTCAPPTIRHIESLIRRHPLVAAMTIAGIGCALGIAAREWLAPPPSPKSRALHLLEDIQTRLAELVEPAYDRAADLADEGLSTMKRGLHSAGGSRLGSRLGRLFS